MSKCIRLMGTACAFAMAAMAGPAAADTLTDFAGNLSTAYQNTDSNISGSDNVNSWINQIVAGGPLSDLPGINFQVDGSYTHSWMSDFSQEVWTLGGDIFWAGPEGRIGLDGHYTNFSSVRIWNTSGVPAVCTGSAPPRATCLISSFGGHETNGGAFAEWYFGQVTGMVKGGWLSPGGSEFGGHGNYLGVGLTGYVMPDLSLTAAFDWQDLVSGRGCGNTCGRQDFIDNRYQILAEYLVDENYGISAFGGYTYVHHSEPGSAGLGFGGGSPVSGSNFSSHDNVWLIGLRWYMGGGPLIDHHRNGNLNPWLAGP